MYYIKKDVDLKLLEKYGFKIGREIPDNKRFICNDQERDDYWLIPMIPGEPEKVFYSDVAFDQPIWSIHIQRNRDVFIDCTPSGTYHIDNYDIEEMFYALRCMIKDGIIEDDYEV